MSEKRPRSAFFQSTDKLIALVGGLKTIIAVLAALSVGGAGGTALSSDKDTSARVDTLEKRIDSVRIRQDLMDRRQMEMFSAQIEADTALRVILEHRAANKRRAAEDRADTEKMFNDILGGSKP